MTRRDGRTVAHSDRPGSEPVRARTLGPATASRPARGPAPGADEAADFESRPLEAQGSETQDIETQDIETQDETGAVLPIEEFQATRGAGERLDRFLAASLPGISRTRLQEWIALGAVWSPGRNLSAKSRLRGDERIFVQPLPREADQAFAADPVDFEVVHADEDLLVINKPAGLVTHPAPGHWRGTLLNGLLHRYPEAARLPRAGIVHRLDRDTSGLLVVGRSESACAALVAQLADRSMSRRYLAFVRGRPAVAGEIDVPIGRDPRHRTRMAALSGAAGSVPAGAKTAVTYFQRLGQAGAAPAPGGADVALVGCRLQTGRTHQIRVHLSHIGHPLEGDALYGGSLARIARQALHATALGLRHPRDGRSCRWICAMPADLHALASELSPWTSGATPPDARKGAADAPTAEDPQAWIDAWLAHDGGTDGGTTAPRPFR